MSWKVVTMDRDAQVDSRWKDLQDTFEDTFTSVGAPYAAAMYTDEKMDTKIVHFYFSPAAGEFFKPILKRLGAKDCPEPASEDVVLLVGHHDARDTSWAAN